MDKGRVKRLKLQITALFYDLEDEGLTPDEFDEFVAELKQQIALVSIVRNPSGR